MRLLMLLAIAGLIWYCFRPNLNFRNSPNGGNPGGHDLLPAGNSVPEGIQFAGQGNAYGVQYFGYRADRMPMMRNLVKNPFFAPTTTPRTSDQQTFNMDTYSLNMKGKTFGV